MTLETLSTFLTMENNNMDNYLVTFEKRVMVTAFAILAMFDIINAPQETRIMPDFNNLTLLRATPSAVSKVWGGRSAPPPTPNPPPPQTPPGF